MKNLENFRWKRVEKSVQLQLSAHEYKATIYLLSSIFITLFYIKYPYFKKTAARYKAYYAESKSLVLTPIMCLLQKFIISNSFDSYATQPVPVNLCSLMPTAVFLICVHITTSFMLIFLAIFSNLPNWFVVIGDLPKFAFVCPC